MCFDGVGEGVGVMVEESGYGVVVLNCGVVYFDEVFFDLMF